MSQTKKVETQQQTPVQPEVVDVKQKLDEQKEKLLKIKQKLEKQTDNAKVDALKSESEQVGKELDVLVDSMKETDKKQYQKEIQDLQKMKDDISNITAKSKEELSWLWKQIHGVMSGKERKENTWTNIARVVWGVGAVALAYKGIKWVRNGLFGGSDEKKEDKKSEKKKDDEWFFDTWYGKTLKWLGIGGAGLAVVSQWDRISNWFGGLFGGKTPDNNSSDKDKFEWYNEYINNPENKEAAENYEDFWGQVDVLYQTVYGRELNSWREDNGDMEEISKKMSNWSKRYLGIVPFCLDNKYENVENILGQNGAFRNILSNGISAMQNYLSTWTAEQLQHFVGSFLDKIPSWGPFKSMWGSLLDRINKWCGNNKNAPKLHFIFHSGTARDEVPEYRRFINIIGYTNTDGSEINALPTSRLLNIDLASLNNNKGVLVDVENDIPEFVYNNPNSTGITGTDDFTTKEYPLEIRVGIVDWLRKDIEPDLANL